MGSMDGAEGAGNACTVSVFEGEGWLHPPVPQASETIWMRSPAAHAAEMQSNGEYAPHAP